MGNNNTILLFLKLLLENLDGIKISLGEKWPGFRKKLLALLQLVKRDRSPDEQEAAMQELIRVGLSAPDTGLFRDLVNQAYTLGGGAHTFGSKGFKGIPGMSANEADPVVGALIERISESAYMGDATPTPTPSPPPEQIESFRKPEFMGDATPLPPPPPAHHGPETYPVKKIAPPKDRYVNTFFTSADGKQTIPAETPLVQHQYYQLNVEVHPQRRGLGRNAAPLPVGSEVLPEEVLRRWQESGEKLPLTVWVTSRDFNIRLPQILRLELPFDGPSNILHFIVQPLREEEKGQIQVEIYFKGNLLQSIQVTAAIVAAAGLPAPVNPAQDAVPTFTATEKLSPGDLQEFPERLVTINTERDPRDNSIDFRFLDRTQGDEKLAAFDTLLQELALNKMIGDARDLLLKLVTGEPSATPPQEGYEWILDGDEARLKTWLPLLAELGHRLYTALLPAGPGRPKLSIAPGTVIQVNPVIGKATFPWALLYEREVWLQPDKVRICPDFRTHAPDKCPHAEDHNVICPHAFWGYRYAIEQIPCWIVGELPRLPSVVRRVNNGQPVRMNMNVWRDFSLWQGQRDRFKAINGLDLQVAENIPEMQKIWSENGDVLDLIYFYSHGGDDPVMGPYLEISDGKVGSNILTSMSTSWLHGPLVLLIGCSTGKYGPENYLNLIDVFRGLGASGVLGSECTVPEMFAEAYMSELLPRILHGERLGQAMLAVRTKFLFERANPLGLLYSLYAPNDLALARALK